MPRLLFATGNEAKLDQLAFVAATLFPEVEVVSAQALYGDRACYEERGRSVAEIARNGALEVAARLGEPVLAEDSGFFVERLGGEPGLAAGAFLAEHGRQGILDRLEGQSERAASLASAACYATPEGRAFCWLNELQGEVALEQRFGTHPSWVAPRDAGDLGGGYNAIFVPEGHARTLAEIPPLEALSISYREPNFQKALALLVGKEDEQPHMLPKLA